MLKLGKPGLIVISDELVHDENLVFDVDRQVIGRNYKMIFRIRLCGYGDGFTIWWLRGIVLNVLKG